MEDGNWNTGTYARKLRDLEKQEDEMKHEETRLRKYLQGMQNEYDREADNEFNRFLWNFTLPDEGDTEGCLVYAEWALKAYEFVRDRLPKAVIGTRSELY